METFHPMEKPLTQKILLHPALHIILIFILVAASVTYIKTSRRQTFLEQVAHLPTGPRVIVNQKSGTEAPPSEEASATTTAAAPTASSPTTNGTANTNPQPSSPPAASSGSLASTSATAPTGAAANRVTNATKIKVYYSEVDTTTLARWVPKMQATGQFSDLEVKIGELPEAEKELASDRSIVHMETVEKSVDNQHANFDWFLGKADDSGDLGLRTSISINELEKGILKGELKLTRYIEMGDPKSIESEFELNSKSGLLIWGVIPHAYQLPPEETMNPKSILQIFKSARFKNQRTEFTILLLFDTPAKP